MMNDLTRRELESEAQRLQDELHTAKNRLQVKQERIDALEAKRDRMVDAMKTIRKWTGKEAIEDLTEIYIDPNDL